MQDHTRIDDLRLDRLAREFDSLASVLRTLIERDRRTKARHQDSARHEQEFTTEWQMEAAPEEVHPG